MVKLVCCKKKQEYETDHELEENEEKPDLEDKVSLERKVYNQKNFSKEHPSNEYVGFDMYETFREMFLKHLKPSKNCVRKNIENRIPCIKWLRSYRIKEYFIADLLAGLTVGIMHIPQGMAYSLLTSLPPIYGLYTSFYPVLIYWIFGTSRHISNGTFAVVSLMAASIIADLEGKYAPPANFNQMQNNITPAIDTTNFLSMNREKARVLIAMSTAFWVGVIQLGMFFLQLGFVTNYLAEPMVNGFLAGASLHVMTSQLKLLFGFKLVSYDGVFKVPKVIYINFVFLKGKKKELKLKIKFFIFFPKS
jgi:hypothetical protein